MTDRELLELAANAAAENKQQGCDWHSWNPIAEARRASKEFGKELK
jgi:hypothetical protein